MRQGTNVLAFVRRAESASFSFVGWATMPTGPPQVGDRLQSGFFLGLPHALQGGRRTLQQRLS
jgi:hypothetical protein